MTNPTIHLSTGKTGPGYTGNCKVTKCEWWICDKPGNENLTTADVDKVTCPKCLEKMGGKTKPAVDELKRKMAENIVLLCNEYGLKLSSLNGAKVYLEGLEGE